MQEQYQCCFCGEEITEAFPDPCSLGFTVGFSLPSEKQTSQGFFCHIKCFESKLHPSTPLYVKDIMEET